MRIVHVIVGLNVGGAELMLKRLVESHLGSTNYEHVVVSLTDIGPVGQQLRAAGVDVYALQMHGLRDTPRILRRLSTLIQQHRPNIVHTWMYHADLLGGIAARMAGVRHIIWGVRTTNVETGNTRSTAAVMRVCAFLSRFVPRIIICAAEAARRSHVAAGYDARKMVVVPNGFDCDAATPAVTTMASGVREQHGIGAAMLVIGNVGRFNEAKDQHNFVKAAGLIASDYTDLRFLMVGRGLDGRNHELASWIASTGHPDRFILLGERPDVNACLSAMDVFCLSSRSEGFPNVLGEAMTMGVPCVSTDVGDAAPLMGPTGVLVAKEDASALATGMRTMLGLTPAARACMGADARRRIIEEFSMVRARARFEEIYEQLAGRGFN